MNDIILLPPTVELGSKAVLKKLPKHTGIWLN